MDSYWDAPKSFSSWFRRAAEAAGYDVTPGRGGRAALARKTGISGEQIGRALDNPRGRPSPESLRRIAEALGKAPLELFVAAGYILPEEVARGDRIRPLTPDEHLAAAARRLDLPPPTHSLFVRLSQNLAAGLREERADAAAEERRSAARRSRRRGAPGG